MAEGTPFATLFAELRGDDRHFVGSMNRARDSLGRFVKQGDAAMGGFARQSATAGQRASSALFTPMRAVASQIQALWQNSLIIAGGAVATGLVTAVKSAGDLEQSFNAIQKVTGLDAGGMDQLEAGLKGIATDSKLAGVSLGDVLSIAEMGGRLGITDQGGPAALLKYTEALAKVKIAMDDIPIEEASTRMGQILNVFGRGSGEALNMASAVDKMADSTTASSRDILDVTQRLSAFAKPLGMTPQQTIALSSAMLDVGISSEVGGTAMGNILSLMAGAPGEFAKVAGVSKDVFTNMVATDPLEALKTLLRALSQLSGMEQIPILKELGIEGSKAKTVMLQLGQTVDKLGPMVGTANREWETMASIEKSVALNSQVTWAQLQSLYNSLKITAASIGNFLLPALQGLASVFGVVSQRIAKYVDSNRGTFKGWIAQVRGFLSPVGAAISGVLTAIGAAFAKVSGGMDFGSALTTIGTALTWARDRLVEFYKAEAAIIPQVVAFFAPVGQAFWDVVTVVGQAVAEFISAVAEIAAAVPAILEQVGITGWAKSAGDTFTWLRDTVVGVLDTIAFMLRNWGAILELVGITIREKLTDAGNLFGWLQQTIGAFLSWFSTNWKTIFADAFGAVTTLLINLGKNIQDFGAAALEVFTSGFTKGFEFTPTAMMEGMAPMQTPGFQAPALPGAANFAAERRAVIDRIAGDELKRQQEKLDRGKALAAGDIEGAATAMDSAAGKLGTGALGGVAAALGTGAGPGAGGQGPTLQPEEKKAEMIGLTDLASKVQLGAFGEKDTQKEMVDVLWKQYQSQQNTEKHLEELKDKAFPAVLT